MIPRFILTSTTDNVNFKKHFIFNGQIAITDFNGIAYTAKKIVKTSGRCAII